MILAYSGAADKISYPFGVYYQREITGGEKPKAIVGTSSGAIMALIEMCGDLEKSLDLALNFTPKEHILGHKPFSPRGISIAAYNILLGRGDGIWKFKKLEKTIRLVTSEKAFNSYNGGDVFVGVTNKFGKIDYRKISELTYDQAIIEVIKSSSIPVAIQTIDGETDGGIIDHIGSAFLHKLYPKENVISVFSRENKGFNKEKPNKIISTLLWSIDRLQHNISIDDERLMDSLAKNANIKHTKLFMDNNPVEKVFSIKPEQNKILFDQGVKSYNSINV